MERDVREKLKCPRCGAEMNHHADKLLASDSESSSEGAVGSTIMEGTVALRAAPRHRGVRVHS
jgi:hypothetical protein